MELTPTSYINIFHVIFVFPLLWYFGGKGIEQKPADANISEIIYYLSFGILFYHLYKIYQKNK